MDSHKKLEIPITDNDVVEGYVIATYDGNTNGVISISSTFNSKTPFEGIDIKKKVSIYDVFNSKEEVIEIIQEGKREVFKCEDERFGPYMDFILADGGTFNVIKDEF